MMRVFVLMFAVVLQTVSTAAAQELFVRSDKYFTELYLKLDPRDVRSVDKGGEYVTVYFSKNVKSPFERTFNDPYVRAVSVKGNAFTVSLKKDSEFSVVNDLNGIKIVATKRKTNSDILSSYGIERPLLSENNPVSEEGAQKEALASADRLIASKRFSEAAEVLNGIIKTSGNDFYRQEAFYRLGQTYMLLAQYNDEYLIDAYRTFDDFVKLYPDNFRTPDAMARSAQAKERANQLFEAIFTYQKIYDSVPDLESKRDALTNVARLYTVVGQLDKAIDAYKTYLKQFRSEKDRINGNIGQIYYDQKEMDLAYEYFSTLSVDKVIKDPETGLTRLFSMARNMEYKKKYPEAVKLYEAVYEKFPDSPQANDAIFSSAEILRSTGRNDRADELLLTLKNKFPDRMSGQKATVEYARKYLTTKPYEYWKEFLGDLLSRRDDFNLHQEARYMLVKSMYAENREDETIASAGAFLTEYPDSQYAEEVNGMREDFIFKKSSAAFAKSDYAKAEPLLLSFKSEYPRSAYGPKADEMLLDIEFFKAGEIYKNGDYKKAAKTAEEHISLNPESGELARWFDLLDDASYKDLSITYASEDYPAARVAARQYLTNFPAGKQAKAAAVILEGAFLKPFKKSYSAEDYQSVIKLYESNGEWLENWPNKPYRDEAATLAALAVYKMGSVAKARELYSKIAPNPTADYTVLSLILGNKTAGTDVNSLEPETFGYVAEEVERIDAEAALDLLKNYTRDPRLTARLRYGIAKNTPGDIRRQEILTEVYEAVTQNEAAAFPGSEEVYLDMGLLFFRKNDFKSAVVPLKKYTDLHKENDDKRAEALYYMGKSFVGMNDTERGHQYYEEIIKTIPESIYAGIAKSEMDEDGWKKNLNRF